VNEQNVASIHIPTIISDTIIARGRKKGRGKSTERSEGEREIRLKGGLAGRRGDGMGEERKNLKEGEIERDRKKQLCQGGRLHMDSP